MLIGVPTEIKNNEYRVGLTPDSVSSIVNSGHTVFIQKGAGLGIGFTDENYTNSGALIINSAKEVYQKSELIIKVKEPVESEYEYLHKDLTLFTYLHLAADSGMAKKFIETGVRGIAYETVTSDDGSMPLLAPMSAIAGQISIVVGSYHLLKHNKGKGVLIGGMNDIAPRTISIIGGGVAGTEALSKALDNKAHVKVIDLSQKRLDELKEKFGTNNMEYILSTPESIKDAVSESDLVIGAVYIPGKEAPQIVTSEMISNMKPGSVIVDISIDQGGCIETSNPTTHDAPTFLVNDVVHYCVTNMPGAVPLTATLALNKATLSYILEIANNGIETTLSKNPHIKNGLNCENGQPKHPGVLEIFNK